LMLVNVVDGRAKERPAASRRRPNSKKGKIRNASIKTSSGAQRQESAGAVVSGAAAV
jgi:hypothetical protein